MVCVGPLVLKGRSHVIQPYAPVKGPVSDFAIMSRRFLVLNQ